MRWGRGEVTTCTDPLQSNTTGTVPSMCTQEYTDLNHPHSVTLKWGEVTTCTDPPQSNTAGTVPSMCTQEYTDLNHPHSVTLKWGEGEVRSRRVLTHRSLTQPVLFPVCVHKNILIWITLTQSHWNYSPARCLAHLAFSLSCNNHHLVGRRLWNHRLQHILINAYQRRKENKEQARTWHTNTLAPSSSFPSIVWHTHVSRLTTSSITTW